MNNTILDSKNIVLEKHKKYCSMYRENEIYWGFGIENEVYLQFERKKEVSKAFFLENHKRERYSVNYYDNYKQIDHSLKRAFENYWNEMQGWESGFLPLPIMMNSHSFINTDINNQSIKLYSKDGIPNPSFSGKTLFDDLMSEQGYFTETNNLEWLFDGDSIEFATIHFYNATIQNVLKELKDFKQRFITNINKFLDEKEVPFYKDNGKLRIMDKNQPFAVYLTNMQNVGIFNNGTLHINITLPTELGENGIIMDSEKFTNDHKKAIRLIQWMEPLFIAVYNNPDPLSLVGKNKIKFTMASQRCAISRYIGVGTYDTDKMEKGKILTRKIEEMGLPEYFWYNKYHETSAYNQLKEIGFDINFNKHYSHGLEIRFFDHISEENMLEEACEALALLMDFLSNESTILNPQKNKLWNDIVVKIMQYGKTTNLINDEQKLYEDLFGILIKNENISDIYYDILFSLRKKYTDYDEEKGCIIYMGEFSKRAIQSKTMSKEEAEQKGYYIKNVVILENYLNNNVENLDVSLEKIHLTDNSEGIQRSISFLEESEKESTNFVKKCCLVS